MLKFLLNANLSRESAKFLNVLGCDAKTVTEFGLGEVEDEIIIALAVAKKRILITFDLDFGEMYYFGSKDKLWIIVLRLKNQTVESVNKSLKRLIASKILEKSKIKNTLIILDETTIRIRRKV